MQNSSNSLVIDTKLYKFGICNHNQTNIISLKNKLLKIDA